MAKRQLLDPAERKRRSMACQVKWREANPERYRATQAASSRQYRQENREKVRALQNAWRAANQEVWKDMLRKSKHKRRARLAGSQAPGVSAAQWAETLAVFNHACAYCLQPSSHCDHLVAIAAGGADSPENVVPACARCNRSKGTKSLPVWLLTTRIAQEALI